MNVSYDITNYIHAIARQINSKKGGKNLMTRIKNIAYCSEEHDVFSRCLDRWKFSQPIYGARWIPSSVPYSMALRRSGTFSPVIEDFWTFSPATDENPERLAWFSRSDAAWKRCCA